MKQGAKTALITFERSTPTTNEYNEEIPGWAEAGKAWAEVRYGAGAERRTMAQEAGTQAATFIVLDNAMTRSVDIKDRINFEGAAWDIQGRAIINRGEIEFSATRSV